ncbi:hypothetical protein [Merismopedia glauca]|uniref:hypothetical protein n=1 Tax=Merismopedia glauca TaxID=292586 RepID=UPI0011B22E11|nr:hypothetical protein [Merismopedia glauca]
MHKSDISGVSGVGSRESGIGICAARSLRLRESGYALRAACGYGNRDLGFSTEKFDFSVRDRSHNKSSVNKLGYREFSE